MKLIQLITTSNEELADNAKIIYLGNWCKKNSYIIKNETVVPYHWDDRKKIEIDNKYLDNLYEKLLSTLCETLNKANKRNNSKEYWRIIIGYWLFYYLSVSFERWENVSAALSKYPNINYYNSINVKNEPISNTTREFMKLTSSTTWNHLIYSKIINFLKKENKLEIRSKTKEIYDDNFYYGYKKNLFHKAKTFLMSKYMHVFKKKIEKNKIVFFKTYLGLASELILNLKFKQLPLFISNKDFEKKINFLLRSKLDLDYRANNLFEKFIIENIFKNIPLEFLENYNLIGDHIEKLNLPIKPLLIISTRSLSSDNIFVRYLAEKKETGTKIFYGQHGGAYGQIKFSWAEDHEIKISDNYLTWGWKKENQNKIIPMFVLKNIDNLKFKKKNEIKKICYFVRSRPKFTGRIDSSTGSNQMAKYYDNCLKYYNNFIKKINDITIIPRFHEAEFEWNHRDIWKNHNIKKFSFTDGESLEKVYKNYELLIYSYISTGFLESLALDKPFILIASTDEWPLRDEAKEDFEDLKTANIYFENEDEAIEHLRKISKNINGWWNDFKVKKIKNKFRNKYAIKNSNNLKIKKIYNLIKNTVSHEI